MGRVFYIEVNYMISFELMSQAGDRSIHTGVHR